MYEYSNGMKQESKRTAIITGSSRGIGKETAIILAKKSVNVVVCSTTQSEISSAVEEINNLTGNSSVLGIKCDVSILLRSILLSDRQWKNLKAKP
jgi:NAD(P)-dependent dehydrogenase (short-subunit alcohol dehydrogenase family)